MKAWIRFLILLGALAIAACTVAACKAPPEEQTDLHTNVTPAVQQDRITRFLVLGCDRAAGLTDSMFVITLNQTQKQATVLQIPRDTYADYTSRDYKKLNGALNRLGAEECKALLSRALGVSLDYYVTVDLDAVRLLVDAVGGVDVVLPQALTYSDPAGGLQIELPKGSVHLDGERAEQLIRYRSGYSNADLGRLDAQKLFLEAFAKQCKQLSPTQVILVMSLACRYLQTDLSTTDALGLVWDLLRFDTENIPMATLAGEAVQGNSGAWYYVINKQGACEMVNQYCMPNPKLTETEFDPEAIFDRRDHADFHKIYTSQAKGQGG